MTINKTNPNKKRNVNIMKGNNIIRSIEMDENNQEKTEHINVQVTGGTIDNKKEVENIDKCPKQISMDDLKPIPIGIGKNGKIKYMYMDTSDINDLNIDTWNKSLIEIIHNKDRKLNTSQILEKNRKIHLDFTNIPDKQSDKEQFNATAKRLFGGKYKNDKMYYETFDSDEEYYEHHYEGMLQFWKSYINDMVDSKVENIEKIIEQKVQERLDDRHDKIYKEISASNISDNKEYNVFAGVGLPVEYITNKKTIYNNMKIDFGEYELVNNLKELIAKYDIPKNILMAILGLSRPTLNLIINNKGTLSLENAYKLSIIFNIPIEELFIYKRVK